MREMIIDQCLGTGREFTREELQEAVNRGLQSRDMLPIKSKVTILQDINEMDEKFRRMYGTSGIVYEDRGRKRYYRYRDGIEMVKQGHNDGLTDEESLLWPNDHQQALRVRRVLRQPEVRTVCRVYNNGNGGVNFADIAFIGGGGEYHRFGLRIAVQSGIHRVLVQGGVNTVRFIKFRLRKHDV